MPLPSRSPVAHLAAILTALLLLAGCGGGEDTETAATRTVATIQGDVQVPTAPQRIVVISSALAGYLFDMGLPVAGVVPRDADLKENAGDILWAEKAKKQGTTTLPWSADGYDLEAILAAKPDLIIGGGVGYPLGQAQKVYDKLTAIAPTVLLEKMDAWQDQYRFLAEKVFDRKADVDRAEAAYTARIAEVKSRITPPPGPSVFLTITAQGRTYVLDEARGLPTVFAQLGIPAAPLYASGRFKPYTPGGDMFLLSTEQVSQEITQPSVFVMGFNANTTDVAALRKNPVYDALPAFRSGRAYDLPYWALRSDYDQAMATLDVVEKLFRK